jgi:hypothetical protein
MSKTVMWRPDTCDCAIIMQYDEKQPQLPPSPSFSRHCKIHADLKDAQIVINENQEKNKAVDVIARRMLVEPTYVRWERVGDRFVFYVPGRDLGEYDKAIIDKTLESQKLTGRMK